MRVYECKIAVKKTGYLPDRDDDEKNIWVLADNVKQAIKKASTYRLAGEVKKTVEVLGVTLVGTIDKF
jgi:hypothetical protein